MNTRVLITGAGGQDGVYLAQLLLAQGKQVHGSVRPDSGRVFVPDDVVVHEADLARPDAVAQLIGDIEPSVIYHLGAVSSVGRSWAHPVENASVNVLGTASVLNAAWNLHREFGEVRVVLAGSAEIFGYSSDSPQNELTRIEPTSPYGASKAFAYFTGRAMRSKGLFVSNAILYNHESPLRSTGFLSAKVVRGVLDIRDGIADKLVLGNMEVKRDWGWAPDVARALMLIAEHDRPDDFVIGTGESRSVKDFVRASFSQVGIDDWEQFVEVDPSLFRPIEPGEQRADSAFARRELGWRPSLSFTGVVAALFAAEEQKRKR